MKSEPTAEHQLLQKMVGNWSFEGEAMMGPDSPTEKMHGSEVVRAVGPLWVVGEGEGNCPSSGDMVRTMITLGYDAKKQRFVGSFIASMMSFMWLYDGHFDTDKKTLILESQGPNMAGEGMAKYRDAIEFRSDDHRVMTSSAPGEDGHWKTFMTAHSRREGTTR